MKIIAELCSNIGDYSWDFDAFCRAAALAGATDAKVQLWRIEMYPEAMREAKHRYEFPRQLLPHFVQVAHLHGLAAGASVFDEEAVDLAARHCDWIKLAARDQDNSELIRYCFRHSNFLYRSISEMRYNTLPSMTTLVTVQTYPCPMWRALWQLARVQSSALTLFPWGWSSHTATAAPGWLDCALAARLGAQVVEKHLALDPSDVEAGHSLLPHEFGRMVEKVKRWAR